MIDFSNADRAIEAAVSTGVRAACELVLKASQQVVPVDTGKLKNSGRIEVQGDRGMVSYHTHYAVYVHEIQKNYRNGRQWKYLEQPFNQRQQEIQSVIADAIRKAL